EIERGGAVGVTVELKGSGNLPAALPVPVRAGVEWLAPETHEKLGTVQGTDRFCGTRTFAYVVRVQKEGDVDLGEIALPFWNPEARAYQFAKAALGTVHVKPGAVPASAADAPPEILPDMPVPRMSLAPPRAPQGRFADSALFWFAVAFAPLAWALV